MHCQSCDCILTAYESTRKYKDGSFVDLCNSCWFNSDMYLSSHVIEREELLIKEEDLENETTLLGNPP